MRVFVTLTTEKWAMREVEDGRKFGGWVWFWREISVAGNICCLTRKRNRSAEHLACILGASLEHAGSIHGASSVQLGVAAGGETFQATSLHTPYGVEGMWAAGVQLFVLARLRRRDAAGGRLYMPALRVFIFDCGLARLRRRDDVDIVCTTGG